MSVSVNIGVVAFLYFQAVEEIDTNKRGDLDPS